MDPNVNSRIAIGAAWMIGLRQAHKMIGLVSITILARLLLPEDFGLVVYATTFIAMLEIFFEFGFETVLIRDQDAGRDSYDTAWTFEAIKGVVLSVLMFIGAHPVSLFFAEPAVEVIVYFLAAMPLLNGLKNIGIVDFQKNMEFDREFIYRFSVRVVGAIITIILAFKLRSHWALVYGMIVSKALALILSYIMSDYRPSICFAKASRIFGFSKWLLFQNLLQGLNDRLPVIVLGRYFEARFAAIYNMGFELSNFASAEFASPIRRVLFPGVASLQDNEQKMVETIIKVIGVIAFFGLPATVGIAVTAPIFIPFLLGENWVGVIPVIQVFAINGICLVLYSNSHVLFYAINKPYLTAIVTGLKLVLLIPAMLFMTPRYGVLGAAWGLSIVTAIVTFVEYIMFFSLVSVKPKAILDAVWRSIVGVSVMGAAVYCIVDWMLAKTVRMPQFVELIISVLAGAACFAATAFLLWLIGGRRDGAESFVIGKLSGIMRRNA